jgi:PmbA protein
MTTPLAATIAESAALLNLAAQALDDAGATEQTEAYATHGAGTSVKVFEGEVETLTVAETRGVGIRLVVDGRMGYASTSDVTANGLRAALEQARANAAHATADPGNVLPEPADWQPLPGIAAAGFTAVDPARKVELALELEELTRAADPRISGVSAASYGDGITRTAIASTTGVRAAYERTDAYATVVALARQGSETQTGFGVTDGRSITELDLQAAADESALRATRLLGSRKAATTTVPVVFDPYVTAEFLGAVASGFSAEAAQKGLSLFADRLEEQVAADMLSVIDDGRLVEGPAAAPVDDEGVPTGRTVIVDSGRLVGFLHNTETAARAGSGARSTANAARPGHRSPPGVLPSNLYMQGSTTPVSDILTAAEGGLYVQEVKGMHSGVNPVSGEFSVGVTGLWIRGGELVEPVREVTVVSTIVAMLLSVGALGADRRFFPMGGAMAGATLLLGEMTVAGS